LDAQWQADASAPYTSPSTSQAAPQAYRLGIIHFRALYSLIRLLPAYRLHRRLRRANNGLKIAVKLWAPEDYTSAELPEAWAVMERGLLGLEHGLESVVAGEAVPPEDDAVEQILPPLELFGLEYDLSVRYRTQVDFDVQDMEAVLSEKLVDMEEEWFTPTVARHRQDSLGQVIPSAERRPSGPSPIPPQGAGSFSRPQSKLGSHGRVTPSSLSKWGALAEGMPFASPPVTSPTLQVSLPLSKN
jgi:autophagy-related protein 13